MKLPVLIIALIFFTSFSLLTSGSTAGSRKDGKWLIFEGTVLKVGKAPPAVCGVLSPYRLAKYHVDRVYEGSYVKTEIIVDHLFCKMNVLEDVKAGDKVVVIIDLQKRPAEIWNDEEVRRKDDTTQRFYVAKSVSRTTSCCDF
jgi:hypothetical protein